MTKSLASVNMGYSPSASSSSSYEGGHLNEDSIWVMLKQ